ncbi:hypothetical protein C3Y98_04550 [Methylotenera oryzisoli]|uniref:Uncharacterized protein n=1 Tax=Methylotenera oryzisoli TaxID=2080758 RepID=A0A4Y9VS90_9PROT|nr:hypothetical protein [Methylotenera oryzisoli]TFW72076.1 hypothetical protein C3Y98_04550 [Methylotenera oryzisoli]
MPATADLQTAFNTSQLPRLGYTFERAMQSKALVTCLTRLAQRKTPQQPIPKNSRKNAAQTYWYNKD